MDSYYYLLAFLLAPLFYIASRVKPSLRLPPGPWQLPLTGSLHHLVGALTHRALRDLARHHAPLMLLKFGENPVIIASSAEAAKEILKTHDIKFCTRTLSASAKVICKHSTGILFAPYGEKWRQRRKICFLKILSAKRLASFHRTREEEAIRFMASISSTTTETKPHVNMSKMLAMHVTDTTVHTIMGGRLKEHNTWLRYVDGALQIVGGFTLPDLFPSSRLARSLCSTLSRADAFRDSLMEFMDDIIAEHIKIRKSSSSEVEHEEDLVDILLRIKGESDPDFPLTMTDVKHIIFDLIAGGSETPRIALQWAMAELVQNPSVMSRAQAEVRGDFMAQMKVTEEGLGDLSYMQCVIKETLRLHSPGPLLPPWECRKQCTILGYDVPKGATVIVSAWAISRDPESWDKPEVFIPDRFLDSNRKFKGNDFEFIPFGVGRRICPGMQFGLANIELALASLLFYFDWSLLDGILPGQLDMTETMGVTAGQKMHLWLRPTL